MTLPWSASRRASRRSDPQARAGRHQRRPACCRPRERYSTVIARRRRVGFDHGCVKDDQVPHLHRARGLLQRQEMPDLRRLWGSAQHRSGHGGALPAPRGWGVLTPHPRLTKKQRPPIRAALSTTRGVLGRAVVAIDTLHAFGAVHDRTVGAAGTRRCREHQQQHDYDADSDPAPRDATRGRGGRSRRLAL